VCSAKEYKKVDNLEDHNMGLLASVIRCGRKLGSSSLILLVTLALGAGPGFASGPNPERIQATYTQGGEAISVTLIIYDYTTASEKQILSQAFGEGRDQGLVAALSKTKAVGHCSITGDLSFDVAFIQMVVTPTGRQITFITNRPFQSDEAGPKMESQSFDLMVGQFDMNDTDKAKSTGFLFPASKLVIDGQGKLHYDLDGSPWSLVNVVDSKWATALAERQAPDAIGLPPQQSSP
jgi:hypothetical protein